MNWDDPTERLALIERVGPGEYNRLLKEHHDKSAVATVNGHRIRPVSSRFGRLFMVDGTDRAFATEAEAKAYAEGVGSMRRARAIADEIAETERSTAAANAGAERLLRRGQ